MIYAVLEAGSLPRNTEGQSRKVHRVSDLDFRRINDYELPEAARSRPSVSPTPQSDGALVEW